MWMYSHFVYLQLDLLIARGRKVWTEIEEQEKSADWVSQMN